MDDLSGYGYCGFCHAIHLRDEDGRVCDTPRPLPVARVSRRTWAKPARKRPPGWVLWLGLIAALVAWYGGILLLQHLDT